MTSAVTQHFPAGPHPGTGAGPARSSSPARASVHLADPGDDGEMTRPVRSVHEAAAAVADAGLMTAFGSDAVPLPRCEAVTGRPM
jgi:hypothetical protein